MFPTLLNYLTFSLVNINSLSATPAVRQKPLAEHIMRLTNRYPVPSVNDVFRDNILLTLAYMNHTLPVGTKPDWDKVRNPLTFSFTLQPGQTFAFDDSPSDRHPSVVKTTNSHFTLAEGFRSDGYLAGDGVCHLASLFHWVAIEAGLAVDAPSNHNFRAIPDIDAKYGTSIYYADGQKESNESHNLYITNTKQHAVTFRITATKEGVTIAISEEEGETPSLVSRIILPL